MSRPRKRRRVCNLPQISLFGPLKPGDQEKGLITMTIDEYETIRLIDHEGMTQEECSQRMNVARTTVQRIYNDARTKLSEALVNGKLLKIEGGDYKLCEQNPQSFGCTRCHRHRHGRML